MTVIRLRNATLMLHSPCAIDARMKTELSAWGPVDYIVAPGSYHYKHVASAQAAFPLAQTFIWPGVAQKRPDLKFDGELGDVAPDGWQVELDQVLVRGAPWICEVAFFHRDTKTLILVDVIENFTDLTPHTNWTLKFWMKYVFRMWNIPRPAPEYQWGWRDRSAARASLQKILEWPFERVIIAHGDLIETDARLRLQQAWKPLLDGVTDA